MEAAVVLGVAAVAAGLAVAGLTAAALAPAAREAVAADGVAGLSKYLSNAAFAFPGGPNGVFLSFSPPVRSLLADLARAIILLAVDILEELDIFEELDILLCWDTELMSEPEPNSLSSLVLSVDRLRPIFLSLPRSPLLFFFSPGNHSLWVDSLEPVDSLSTLVSRSSLRMVIAL